MKSLKILFALSAVIGFGSQPASAALVLDEPCDVNLTTPDAVACSGYWEGNLLGGSPAKVQDQIDAIAMLPSSYVFDGNWGPIDATKITALNNGNEVFPVSTYGTD